MTHYESLIKDVRSWIADSERKIKLYDSWGDKKLAAQQRKYLRHWEAKLQGYMKAEAVEAARRR
jgi:hypothetical protein